MTNYRWIVESATLRPTPLAPDQGVLGICIKFDPPLPDLLVEASVKQTLQDMHFDPEHWLIYGLRIDRAASRALRGGS